MCVHVCFILVCSIKQDRGRGETWMLEHCPTNNINSDTVATVDVASTKIAIVPSLNFQAT